MLRDPKEIARQLTPPQRQCILDLSEEWKGRGYNKVYADILYALGDSDLHGAFGALVDCKFHRQEGVAPEYQHRLLPLGLEVKASLEEMQNDMEIG